MSLGGDESELQVRAHDKVKFQLNGHAGDCLLQNKFFVCFKSQLTFQVVIISMALGIGITRGHLMWYSSVQQV
jgi:hypothetical protein